MGTERSEACGYTLIELCVRRGAGPIEGTCQDGSGHAAPFWGWLELISALETARTRDPRGWAEGGWVENGQEAVHSTEGKRGASPAPAIQDRQAT